MAWWPSSATPLYDPPMAQAPITRRPSAIRRFFRWKPKTYPQVLLMGLAAFVMMYLIGLINFGPAYSLIQASIFGGGTAAVEGLGLSMRRGRGRGLAVLRQVVRELVPRRRAAIDPAADSAVAVAPPDGRAGSDTARRPAHDDLGRPPLTPGGAVPRDGL
jgi:hypothetical protein